MRTPSSENNGNGSVKQTSGHESGFDKPYSENVCRFVGSSKARWIAGSNSGIGRRSSSVMSDTGDGSEIVVVDNSLTSEFGNPVDTVVVVVAILSGTSESFTIRTASLNSQFEYLMYIASSNCSRKKQLIIGFIKLTISCYLLFSNASMRNCRARKFPYQGIGCGAV